jgi:hypothetical protein
MNRIVYILLAGIVWLSGCRTEQDVDPAQESTFIRYFGTENGHNAVLALEVADGFALLSTTEIERGPGQVDYKIKFTKTDLFGNLVWERNYPNFSAVGVPEASMLASSFIPLNSGYLIIGDSINQADGSKIQLLHIGPAGEVLQQKTISVPSGAGLHGKAVMQKASGNLVILGNVDDDDGGQEDDMYIAELDATTFNVIWSRQYGAGDSELINRIYSPDDQNYFWAGSVEDDLSENNDIRVIHAPQNSQTVYIGAPVGSSEFDEKAIDFCASPGGWMIAGSTNASGTKDLYLMKVSQNSQVIFEGSFEGMAQQDEEAVSIAPTSDGGFIVLGTAGTPDRAEDLILMKTNVVGTSLWQAYFGNADRQLAASVRETSDHSFLIFATTYFGDERKLMLLKVNRDGQF